MPAPAPRADDDQPGRSTTDGHTEVTSALSRHQRISALVALDRESSDPPVVQIHRGLAAAIMDGTLPAGTRLPTVRALAQDLDVAVNTVAKAFRRLEQANLVITRGRAGTVVAPLDTSSARLEAAAQQFAEVALGVGLSQEEALRIIATALADRGHQS